MLTKWIQFTVAPESAETFRGELARIQAASKVEVGCLHYSAFRSEVTNIFTVLESWQDEASFEAHRASPHIAEFKRNCASMIVDKAGLELDPIS